MNINLFLHIKFNRMHSNELNLLISQKTLWNCLKPAQCIIDLYHVRRSITYLNIQAYIENALHGNQSLGESKKLRRIELSKKLGRSSLRYFLQNQGSSVFQIWAIVPTTTAAFILGGYDRLLNTLLWASQKKSSYLLKVVYTCILQNAVKLHPVTDFHFRQRFRLLLEFSERWRKSSESGLQIQLLNLKFKTIYSRASI